MRSEAAPYLVAEGQPARPLERIAMSDREINEGFLQQLLDENPGIVPVAEFDESFGPIASLGREIMGIDNLFISRVGRLTLVETKLWRNPQAVREVLAQVIDYASRLAELKFETFEERCRESGRSSVGSAGLFGVVQSAFPELVPRERDFIDRITRDLRNGRFLLLVVGDGIREGLERMLSALHHQPRLHFTFGLVELRLYRASTGILAIPSVVCHSTEIERAIVTVRGAEAADVQVEVRSDPQEKAPKLTEREFLEKTSHPQVRQFAQRVFEWARDNGTIDIVARSAGIRVPFSSTRKGLILMRIFPNGKVFVTPPKLRGILQNAGVEEDLALEIATGLKQLYPGKELRPDKDAVLAPMRAEELLPKVEEILEIYQRVADRAAEIDSGVSAGEDLEDETVEGDDE